MNNEWVTRQTLIQRARNQDDQNAWEEFVTYYGDFIVMILCKMNLSQSEQDDLTQEVLLKLWKNLEVYSAEKAGFRTWLAAVIRKTILKFFEADSRRRVREDKAARVQEFTDFLSSKTDPELEEVFEREWKGYITTKAMENLKGIFSGKAIEAFEMTMEEVPVDEICKKLEIKKESLYVLRNRVKSRFIEEVRHLTRELQF